MAKIEAGKLELDQRDCDLAAVESAVRLFEGRAEQAGVSLRFTARPRRLNAEVDERAIRQIVLNLLSNAVKFTDKGGEVRVSVADDGAGGCLIAIEDNGIGIPEAEMEKVLRPFEQGVGARIGREAGTGPGLPISKALVEAHGGTFEIASMEGRGTTVRIRLPARSASASVA